MPCLLGIPIVLNGMVEKPGADKALFYFTSHFKRASQICLAFFVRLIILDYKLNQPMK